MVTYIYKNMHNTIEHILEHIQLAHLKFHLNNSSLLYSDGGSFQVLHSFILPSGGI